MIYKRTIFIFLLPKTKGWLKENILNFSDRLETQKTFSLIDFILILSIWIENFYSNFPKSRLVFCFSSVTWEFLFKQVLIWKTKMKNVNSFSFSFLSKCQMWPGWEDEEGERVAQQTQHRHPTGHHAWYPPPESSHLRGKPSK